MRHDPDSFSPSDPRESSDAAFGAGDDVGKEGEPKPAVITADVVVVGSGLVGLVAARECARIGARVLVTSGRRPVSEDGNEGTESVADADREEGSTADETDEAGPAAGLSKLVGGIDTAEFPADGAVAALARDLELGDEIEIRTGDEQWWLKLNGDIAPVPQVTLAGIPGSPLAEDVSRVLGRRGALRAYLDRLRPILTIGREKNLGQLVRTRMGDRAWERLVAPVIAGRFGDDPEAVLVAAVSPSLNAAMTRNGSLSGGVTELLAAAPRVPARATLKGGLRPLLDALAENCRFLGGELRPDLAVTAIDEVADDSVPTDRWLVHTADGGVIHTRAVILAVDRARATSLAGNLLGRAWEGLPPAHREEITTLVLDAPELDGAPRGGGVVAYSAEGSSSRMVHHVLGGPHHRHTLHLVSRIFSAQAAATATATATAAATATPSEVEPAGDGWSRPTRSLESAEVEAACAVVTDLFGIEVRPDSVIEAVSVRRQHQRSAAAQGQALRVESFEAAVAAHPGLAMTGDWLAGPSHEEKVEHAHAAAQGIRGQLVREGFHLHL